MPRSELINVGHGIIDVPELRARGFGNIIEERLLEKRSTSDTIYWLSKAATLWTRRWILSSPRCQKLLSSFPPARKLSSCSLPASDGCYRYVPHFRVRDLHRKPDIFNVQCIHCAIAHLVISTFIMLALPSVNHPNDAPRISYTDSAPFSTVRYSSMDSSG